MHLLRHLRPVAVLLFTAAACGDFTLSGDEPAGGGTTGGSAPATVSSASTSTGGGTTAGETGGTTGGSTTGGSTTGANACPTYANFAQKFFTDSCSKCHNANSNQANFQDFNKVVSSIDGTKGIKAEIDGGKMPQGGPAVSGVPLQMIDAWMNPNCRK